MSKKVKNYDKKKYYLEYGGISKKKLLEIWRNVGKR